MSGRNRRLTKPCTLTVVFVKRPPPSQCKPGATFTASGVVGDFMLDMGLEADSIECR